MNFSTLQSLVKLFALAANKQSEDPKEKYSLVFKNFLDSEIEKIFVSDAQSLFESYLSTFSSQKSDKKISLNSVRIIRICEEIRTELSVSDRLQLLYYLLTLINAAGNSKSSEDFTTLVAGMFGINESLYTRLSDFLNDRKVSKISDLIFDENKIGEVLNSEVGIIFVKVLKSDFILNGKELSVDSVSLLTKDSVLIYKNIKKYFFSELISSEINSVDSESFCLNLKDVELERKGRTLLHKTNLTIKSGELVGVIGKSGSGKTSLLKCIAGSVKDFKGQVYICNENNQASNQLISFVPQEDSFIPLFSVQEHLIQRCQFLQIPVSQHNSIVEQVLKDTSLSDDRAKKVCKSDMSMFEVSGGQMKRLGIAMELLANPNVMLLDEPTSGLSSEDSYKIINLLKRLAKRNKIVLASVHQPDFDIFMMFDKILIIDEGGYPVYFGTPSAAAEYFRIKTGKVDKSSLLESRYNPAVLLKLIEERGFDEEGLAIEERKISPQEYYKSFNETIHPAKSESKHVLKTKSKQNSFVSIYNHASLSLRVDFRQKLRFAFLLLVPLITGVLFSILTRYSPTPDYVYFYNPNIPVWILILLTTAIFIGLVSSGHEFIFLREFYRNQNRLINKSISHLTSVIIRYLFLSLLQTILLILPAVLIMENSFHFVNLFLISFSLLFWGSLVGLLLSKLLANTNIVYLIIPLIIIPQMVFSGALIPFGNFNLMIQKDGKIPLIANLVPMRWASEAIITDFYCNNPYYSKIYPIRQDINNAVYYLDYFIPAVEKIAEKDIQRATQILENETSNPGFVLLDGVQLTDIDFLKKYYQCNLDKSLYLEDSLLSTGDDPQELKLRNSNSAVNKVVNSTNLERPMIIEQEILLRCFKPIYCLPGTNGMEDCFFKSYGKIGNNYFATLFYNFIILVTYNLFLIAFLAIFTIFQNKYKVRWFM